MPDLGQKHECFACEARFYDLGRPEAICPKCGANQKDAKKAEPVPESRPVRRRRRDEVVKVAAAELVPDGSASGSGDGDDDVDDSATDPDVDIEAGGDGTDDTDGDGDDLDQD